MYVPSPLGSNTGSRVVHNSCVFGVAVIWKGALQVAPASFEEAAQTSVDQIPVGAILVLLTVPSRSTCAHIAINTGASGAAAIVGVVANPMKFPGKAFESTDAA